MRNFLLRKLTYLAFISLAFLPLVEENVSSMTIIFTLVMVILNVIIINKTIQKPPTEVWLLSIIFWMFFFRELFSPHLDFSLVIQYLPFIVFPLIFYYKPVYINRNFLRKTITVFQVSILFKLIMYLVLFLNNNSIETMFNVSNENIPFFRDYIFTHSKIVIHPTYFSSFLLFSFTISMAKIFQNKSKIKMLWNSINIIITLFFILLLSAKIIILLVPVTLVAFLFSRSKKIRLKGSVLLITFFFILFFSPVKKSVIKRFDEIKTEISKPIQGDYFNSTNVRVAILNCSIELTKTLPLFGYGNTLQQKLNRCYGKNNKSNFYRISTYNTHNFYLNILLYAGLGGLFLFLWLFFILFKKNKNNQLALLLLIQVMIINLTENFFSRHYGIVVFSYLISLFISIYQEEKEGNVSRLNQI